MYLNNLFTSLCHIYLVLGYFSVDIINWLLRLLLQHFFMNILLELSLLLFNLNYV